MQTEKNGIITSLNGDNVLTYKDSSHRYSLNKKPIRSVTGIGKQGYPESHILTGWKIGQGAEYAIKEYAKLADELCEAKKHPTKKQIDEIIKSSKTAFMVRSQAAADVGSAVHDRMYELDCGNPETMPEDVDITLFNKCIKAAMPWRKEVEDDEIIALEEIVASVVRWYAGKFDRLSRRKGKVILTDYKTSSGIFVDMFLQLALYRQAIQEWLGITVDAVEIVRFGKDGAFEHKLVDDPVELKAYEDQANRNILTCKFRKEYESRYGF